MSTLSIHEQSTPARRTQRTLITFGSAIPTERVHQRLSLARGAAGTAFPVGELSRRPTIQAIRVLNDVSGRIPVADEDLDFDIEAEFEALKALPREELVALALESQGTWEDEIPGETAVDYVRRLRREWGRGEG